jgi:hypothetical protein
MAGSPPGIDYKTGLQTYLLLRRVESFDPSPVERKAIYQRIYFLTGMGMGFQGEVGIFDGGQQTHVAQNLL